MKLKNKVFNNFKYYMYIQIIVVLKVNKMKGNGCFEKYITHNMLKRILQKTQCLNKNIYHE